MWRALFLTILVAALAEEDLNEYNFDTYKNEIEAKCLIRLWSNPLGPRDMYPSGQTMQSFITMVEQVEGNHTDWNIYDVSKALLKRFAFEGIEYKEQPDRIPAQSLDAGHRWEVVQKLVGENMNRVVFDEDDLNEVEKCTMFFMIGHLVNDTYRGAVDADVALSDISHDPASEGSGIQRSPGYRSVKQPREQGVVSIHGNAKQAIAMAYVLNAIVASENDEERRVDALYNIQSSKFPKDMKISPLYGVTLGSVLTRAATGSASKNSGARYFGPGGNWNTTLCPIDYKLDNNETGATTALLRGAVDGLLIGRALKEGQFNSQGVSLSRVLRMYYSPKGIPKSDNSQQGYSYCNREDANSLASDARTSILSFYYVYRYRSIKQVDEKAEQNVDNAITQMISALSSLKSDDTATEECRERYPPPPEEPKCETPSNVLVLMDISERDTKGFINQKEVVGMLASRFDFGRGSGSLSVFQKSVRNNDLLPIAYNSTNPTCATCQILRINQYTLSKPDSEFQLMEALNKTLTKFERETDLEPGVPNKVVVLFHFDELKDEQAKLVAAGNMLRDGHRDTRILAVGKYKNGLSHLVNGDGNVITDINNPEVLVKELASRICKVPAILQFNRGYAHKKTGNEDQNVYTGYITDNHVQFWAFYPEYFLNTFVATVKFHVEGSGDIYVCEQRGMENPGFHNGQLNRQRCRKTDNGHRDITFTFKNPCEGYEVHNCPTINFAIIGDVKEHRSYNCPDGDMKCRRFDQIKFQVSHTVVYSCPAIHGLENGQLSGVCQAATQGNVCAFTCNDGFFLEGSKGATCVGMPDGTFQWDSHLPFCRAAKCTDLKDDTGETWDLFCQMQENLECLDGTTSGQPPRCSCKSGCKEKEDGTCVCEDICDQKDKHRFLLKGFFSVLLERQ